MTSTSAPESASESPGGQGGTKGTERATGAASDDDKQRPAPRSRCGSGFCACACRDAWQRAASGAEIQRPKVGELE